MVEIERLKANERALILEQQAITALEIKKVREEMQGEIDKLTIQITVCYEKIGHRDSEIRKLLIAIEEYKEWKVKYEVYQKQVVIQIARIKADYEQVIVDLNSKLEKLQRDYDKLEAIHNKCGETVYRLEQ